MTTKRRAYHHGDLRRALIGATLELLKEHDAEALTLREVARRVGVDHTAAYRHFEDKTALLAAVAEEGFRQLSVRMSKSVAGADAPLRRLRRLASAYVAFALAHPEHYRVMTGPRLNLDERFPALEAVVVDAFQLLVAEVKKGIASGALRRTRKPEDVAVSIWSA